MDIADSGTFFQFFNIQISIGKRNIESTYYETAYKFACEFVSKQFKPFPAEDVKEQFHLDNDPPDDPRIWGNIFRRLKTENRIVFHSYQKCKSKKGHGHPSTVWISREYSEKQSANRKINSKTQITLAL